MFNTIKNYLQNLIVVFTPIPNKVQNKIPFFSQWESIDLVDKILSHAINAKDDPKWQYSAAISKDEYELWSWNICGVACLRMILSYTFGKAPTLIELAKTIEKYGGYKIKNNGSIDGLFYKPFIECIEKEFHLHGQLLSPLTLKRIKSELAKKNQIIVSVNPTIRNENAPTPENKGGHLVLVTGYDEDLKMFFINNPSGYYRKSQHHHRISYFDFIRFFSGKGIAIVP